MSPYHSEGSKGVFGKSKSPIKQVKKLRKQGKYSEAKELIEKILVKNGDNFEAKIAYIDILARKKDWASAAHKADELFPNGFGGAELKKGFYRRLSKSYFKGGMFDNAETMLDEGLLKHPAKPSLLLEKHKQLYIRLRWGWTTYNFWLNDPSEIALKEQCKEETNIIAEKILRSQSLLIKSWGDRLPKQEAKNITLSRLLITSLEGDDLDFTIPDSVDKILYYLCAGDVDLYRNVRKVLETSGKEVGGGGEFYKEF